MKRMKLDYKPNKKDTDEKTTELKKKIYKNNLIKKYSFLQRKDTQFRIFTAFMAQIDVAFDSDIANVIHEQINYLEDDAWSNEVDRVFNILDARSDDSNDSDSSNKDKTDEKNDKKQVEQTENQQNEVETVVNTNSTEHVEQSDETEKTDDSDDDDSDDSDDDKTDLSNRYNDIITVDKSKTKFYPKKKKKNADWTAKRKARKIRRQKERRKQKRETQNR